jgi:nucleoside-diphosphate-sugar epimerase
VGDLCDADFSRQLVDGADAVFHFAGQTSIRVSSNDPLGDLRANVASTLTLLHACSLSGRRPAFVYAGTATEIGLTTSVPIPPLAPDKPATVYDANKLAAEQLVGVYADQGAVHGVTLRIANVFGPGAVKSAADRGITNWLIARAMSGNDLTYYGDGFLVRDYVYIDDLLEAFFRAAVVAERASSRSYVVAGGKAYTLRESFELIADVVAEMGYPRVMVSSAPWPESCHPIDRRSFLADVTPLRALMDWQPTTSLREGIRLTARALIEAREVAPVPPGR